MDCEFCTVKGRPRHASPERLLEQISYLVETRRAKQFFIVDDLFGQQRDETIRFCNMLADYQKRIGKRLNITVQIRLDKARDRELLGVMKEAGVQTVAIGFESPIDEELKVMKKHISSAEMLSLARVYHKFGFFIHGMFIFGYPMAEKTDFKMLIKERVNRYKNFIKKAQIDTVQVLLPVPLPGTELRQRLENQKRIYPLADVGWEYYDGNFPLFVPDEPLSSEELQIAAKKIMRRFYHFKYMFLVVLNIFSFPALALYFYDIRSGWRRWYQPWRNYLLRFGGWLTMRKWYSKFKEDNFTQKLHNAREHLMQSQ